MNVQRILLTMVVGLVATWSVQAKTIDLGEISDTGQESRTFVRAAELPTIPQPATFAAGLSKSVVSLELPNNTAPYSLASFPFGELDLRKHYAASFAGGDGFLGGPYLSALKLGSVSKTDFLSMLFIVAVLAVYQLRRKQKYLQHPLVM